VKSNKQRRKEILERRQKRAEAWEHLRARDARFQTAREAAGRITADHAQLAHNNTYGLLPEFYEDRSFTCRNCGSSEVWAAARQKWWYEIAKGNIYSEAVLCLRCRKARREQAAPQNDLLGDWVRRLRLLGGQAENANARQEVEEALNSKWWGVREVAVSVLGHWGGSENKQRLRNWIEAGQESKRYYDWEYRLGNAASKAIAFAVTNADADWLLPLYLRDRRGCSNWLRPVLALPMDALAEPIAKGLKDPDSQVAWRAFSVLTHRLDFPARSVAIAALRDSPHGSIARYAQWETARQQSAMGKRVTQKQ
jgi:Probable zinc-ribbon domain